MMLVQKEWERIEIIKTGWQQCVSLMQLPSFTHAAQNTCLGPLPIVLRPYPFGSVIFRGCRTFGVRLFVMAVIWRGSENFQSFKLSVSLFAQST